MPPVLSVVKMVSETEAPLHTVTLSGWLTCAVGFTVMVNAVGCPVQVSPA